MGADLSARMEGRARAPIKKELLQATLPTSRCIEFKHTGLSFEEFDHLVWLVYSGTHENVPWTGMLNYLRALLDANYVSLILRLPHDQQPLRVVYAGKAGPVFGTRIFTDFIALDPFINLPRNRMVALEELIDDATWQASSCYQEFYAPLHVRYHLAADVGEDSSEPVCRLRITRPPTGKRFGARERAICNVLLPHLEVAVQLRSRLDIADVEQCFYSGMLGRLSVGIVFLDTEGRVLKVNDAADAILAKGDGLSISSGFLTARTRRDDRDLRKLIEHALEAGGRRVPSVLAGMAVRRTPGRSNLGVAVRAAPPTRWSEPSSRPAALVIIRDPEATVQVSQMDLKRLYGLTSAEASIAQRLINGCTIDDAAMELNVSRNTVRSQVRAIFAKTGVSRQADLLRTLLHSVAPLS